MLGTRIPTILLMRTPRKVKPERIVINVNTLAAS
jgi:hypothetical protein